LDKLARRSLDPDHDKLFAENCHSLNISSIASAALLFYRHFFRVVLFVEKGKKGI